jgi:hypothetical protein
MARLSPADTDSASRGKGHRSEATSKMCPVVARRGVAGVSEVRGVFGEGASKWDEQSGLLGLCACVLVCVVPSSSGLWVLIWRMRLWSAS